jgi:ATP diphosphatase
MSARQDPAAALESLLQLMRRLRDPDTGCPWDRAQTHESLARYAIEEAYETDDAISCGDRRKLRDELGDLLFQIVFHAQLGSESGDFDFASIAGAVHDKLVRRHPHVFRREAPGIGASHQDWEAHKARERHENASADRSALADIPRAAPALLRATKIGRRASAVGFDWKSEEGVREKIAEELAEVEQAIAARTAEAGPTASNEVFAEIGDLLLSVAHWARHLGVDPEAALRFANAKFETRFRAMERLAAARRQALQSMPPDALEALWREVKAQQQGSSTIQAAFTEPGA